MELGKNKQKQNTQNWSVWENLILKDKVKLLSHSTILELNSWAKFSHLQVIFELRFSHWRYMFHKLCRWYWFTYTHIYIHAHIYMSVCVHECAIYVYRHTYTHIYIYIYICCAKRRFYKIETGTKTCFNNSHILLLKILHINSVSCICNLRHTQCILFKHDSK